MFRVLLSATLVLAIGVAEAHAKRGMKPPPTAEQILARKTQVFTNLDKNHDGRLTLEEYLADKRPDAKEQITAAFKVIDKDGKGVTLPQFLANYDALMAAGVVHSFEHLKTQPFANIKTAPVAVAWQYSNDGGKTFGNKPHASPHVRRPPQLPSLCLERHLRSARSGQDCRAVGPFGRTTARITAPRGPRSATATWLPPAAATGRTWGSARRSWTRWCC